MKKKLYLFKIFARNFFIKSLKLNYKLDSLRLALSESFISHNYIHNSFAFFFSLKNYSLITKLMNF